MAKYTIDLLHSEIKFKVKHLMISTVTGEFKTFDVVMESENPDFTDAKITFEADINSISTSNEQRDGHLKSDDFFSAEQFPKMTFVSTSFVKTGDSDYKLNGNLTIRDVTKPVTLNVEYGGTMVDFYGQTKVGFEVTGTIKRKEFNLTWDAVTEAGGVVLSDEVKLLFSIQLAKQTAKSETAVA